MAKSKKVSKENTDIICQEIQRLQKSGATEEEYRHLFPRKKVLFNVVDMDRQQEGVKVWVAPYTAADDIVRLCYDKRTKEIHDISHPVNGYDVFITREGEGLTTKYKGIQLDRNPSSIANENWLDELYDLREILIIPDEKDMKQVLGIVDRDDEETYIPRRARGHEVIGEKELASEAEPTDIKTQIRDSIRRRAQKE